VAMCALDTLENTTMKPEYEALSGLPLIYAVLKRTGYEMLGRAEGPFAFTPHGEPAFSIVTGDARALVTLGQGECELFMLEQARQLGAHFHVSENHVRCVIDQHLATGASYAEAAGRAMLMWSDPGTPESSEE